MFVPGPIQATGACDRTALPAEDLEKALGLGLSCQLTGQDETVTLPARLLNARKGDILLVPGGMDIIGQLLRQVDPPQDYAHTCIVTRDFEEIAHSTADQNRMLEYIDFDLAHPENFCLAENAIKYIWPGAIRQTVGAAVDGEDFPDPEAPHKLYKIRGFIPHHVGVFGRGAPAPVAVPPLVVKPHPHQETKAVRAKLHQAADLARQVAARPGQNSKTHYRFFCYTDPAHAEGQPAPANAGWAAGTFPSVCSSFVRKMVLDAGIHMNPDDGLAPYTEAERKTAALWLDGFIKGEAFKKFDIFAQILRADVRAANQIVNAFVNDDVNGMESLAWKNPGSAKAVSPSNILNWVGPDQDGCYGYAETLRYRPSLPVTRPASQWRPFTGTGRIRGKVFRSVGAAFVPVAEARVRVFEGCSALSDDQGRFVLENVPRGRYLLDAEAQIDGLRYAHEEPVNLDTADHEVESFLIHPPRFLDARRIEVYLGFSGTEPNSPALPGFADNRSAFVRLGRGVPQGTFNPIAFEWGGGLRARYTLTFDKRAITGNPVKYPVDVTVSGEVRRVEPGGGQTVLEHKTLHYTVESESVDARVFKIPFQSGLASLLVTVRNVQDDW
jgi:hypothetical protein